MQINTSNSTVSFTIKKLYFLTVKGTLSEVKGEVKFNEDNLSDAKIEIAISVKGVDTKNAKRDKHLLTKDFFDVEKFPEITFKSRQINKKNEGYLAKGELSMVGVTHTIEIPFQFKNNRATGQFSLNRLDFKLGKIPAFVAAKNVDISFDCSL